MTLRIVTTLALSSAVVFASSCAEPSRERYVADTAEIACERFDECGDLEENYGSFDECLSDMESNFFDLWPDDQCGNGEMNRDAVVDCQDRAAVYSCDANAIDLFSFLQSCNADQVCTDPAN